MQRLAWLLYQTLMAGGMAVAAPFLLARRGRHYLETLPGRLGLHQGAELRGAVWLHAVSVGEVAVAATLARALPESLPLLVTTVTPTGQARARETFSRGVFAARRTAVAYLPFDLGFALRRFFRRFAPRALILVEGDYWPLALREAGRRRLPVAVVNGRVGDRSAARMALFPRLCRRLFFSHVRAFGAQTEEDRRRLIAAGAPAARIHCTGNLKYDTPRPTLDQELAARLRTLAGGRPILVAGSTMPGEEEQVLDAFSRLGGGRRALLVLAPRHPERFPQVAELVRQQGHDLARRSALDEAATGRAVLLLDSLGELAGIYSLADVAFIGGTLVPTGGHNPLEPAHFAVPIAVGPAMDNFREMAARFDETDAWRVVHDAAELAATCDAWLRDPAAARAVGERAAALLTANRGAVARTLALVEPLLAEPAG